jgi:CDP-diglyceride synthetase
MADEPENTESTDDPPAALRSGRVRIVGAEPAEQRAASLAPELPDDADFVLSPSETGLDLPIVTDTADAPVEFDGSPAVPLEPLPEGEPDLPHWTEAPTGEVPAILVRDAGETGAEDDRWSAMPAPTWREEHTDWEAQEETFEPSMLAHDDTKLGSLDDSGESDRQPWSFDLPGTGAADEPEEATQSIGVSAADDHDDQDTMIVPSVRMIGGSQDGFSSDESGSDASGSDESASDESASDESGSDESGSDESGSARVPLARSTDATTYPSAVGSPVVVPDVEGAIGGAVAGAASAGLDPSGLTGASADDVSAETRSRRGARAPGRTTRRRGRPPQPRPVPLAPEERVADGTEAPASRPVPSAPPPRQSTPRPRPGGGLRPPEPPRETTGGRNLQAAIVSGLAIGVIALACFKLGSVAAISFVTVVVALATLETYAAFRKAAYHPVTLLGLVAAVSLMIATYNKGSEALPLVIVLLVAFTLLWHLVGVERSADPVRSTASTLLVFCWIAVFGSFAALLLNPTLFPDRHGIAFLLGAIITSVAYDVAALATGSWIGSHPLAPTISPNKTWEGLVGGAIGAILVAVLVVQFIHPWTFPKAFALGVVVAVVSPVGDLSESLIKRNLGLKDMGRMLPGHGGLLDRMDGLLFVLPATYYLVKALHLG